MLSKNLLLRSLISSLMFFAIQANSQQTVGIFLNDSSAYNGYTLFSISKSTYLIDNCGFPINQWTSDYTPGLSAYLLDNGDLLRVGKLGTALFGTGNGGIIERYSWEGERVWSFDYAESTYRQHHDIEPMPNGNILILGWEIIPGDEVIAAGRDPAATGVEVWSEFIVEIEPMGSDEGQVIWEWHAWDHLVQEFDSGKANYGNVADHPELFDVNYMVDLNPNTNQDWMHANAISYNEDRDEIAISSRNFSEIWIIDHSTTTEEAAGHSGGNGQKGGDLLYRYGNPQTYKRGTSADQQFFRQHNIRWIPEGFPHAGKLMVFNNGVNRPGGSQSSADIFSPPLDADGQYSDPGNLAYGPQNLDWTYADSDYYSSIMSSAQILPNGNVLMCFGEESRFREVTPTGDLVWDYQSPVGNTGPITQGETASGSIFRATRFAPDFPGFAGKDISPGSPIELEPISLDCTIYENEVSTDDPTSEELLILQNPVSHQLLLHHPTQEKISIEIRDLGGRLIDYFDASEVSITRSTTNWAPGIYFIVIRGLAGRVLLSEKIVKH